MIAARSASSMKAVDQETGEDISQKQREEQPAPAAGE